MHNEFSPQKHRSLFQLRRSKIKVIAAAFGLVGACIAVYVLVSIIGGEKLVNVIVSDSGLQKNAFLKFFYKTSDASGKEVVILAEKVIEETKDNFVFERVTSNFMLPNEETGTITSNRGKIIHGERSVCEFIDNVVMTTNNGLLLRTERAIFDSNKKIISGNSRVNIAKDKVKMSAENYSFDTENNVLTLTGNAKANSDDRDVSANEIIIAFDNSRDDSVKSLTANGKATLLSNNYDLSAENLLKYDTNKIEAEKNADLLYKKDGKNFRITSARMSAFLNDKSEIAEIIADGNVRIKTRDSVVKADHGVYKGDKVTVSGNVIISKERGDVFGEVAELDMKTENISVKKSSGVVSENKGKH